MCEAEKITTQLEILTPEYAQWSDLSRRAEELCGCVEEITALLMQMPTDVLSTPEGEDFFQSAASLTARLKKQIAIITRETGSLGQD